MGKDKLVYVKDVAILVDRITGWKKRSEGQSYYIDVYLDSGKPIEILVRTVDTRWDSGDIYNRIDEEVEEIVTTLKGVTGVLDE